MRGLIDQRVSRQLDERSISLTVCLILAFNSVMAVVIHSIRSWVVLPFKLDVLMMYGVLALAVLLAVRTVLSRVSARLLLVVAGILFAYFLAFLLNSQYHVYYLQIGCVLMFQCVPCLLLGYAIRDYSQLRRFLTTTAYVIVIAVVLMAVFHRSVLTAEGYSQQYAYALLPAAIVFADLVLKERRIIHVIALLTAVISIIAMGARGPILSLIVYAALRVLISDRGRAAASVKKASVVMGAAFLVAANYDWLLARLLQLLTKWNLSIRTVSSLMERRFFQSAVRDRLLRNSLELIRQNPVLGVGVARERILLAEMLGSSAAANDIAGWYPHNILLEVLLHFGIFIGGVSILYVLKMIYVSVVRNHKRDDAAVVLMFLGISLVPLLFSSSYITSPLFFLFLGMCLYQNGVQA